jgi:hypothetical protein
LVSDHHLVRHLRLHDRERARPFTIKETLMSEAPEERRNEAHRAACHLFNDGSPNCAQQHVDADY